MEESEGAQDEDSGSRVMRNLGERKTPIGDLLESRAVDAQKPEALHVSRSNLARAFKQNFASCGTPITGVLPQLFAEVD